MFYGQIKRAVLERINQYSVAGETVSPAYNNQSDYIQRIPNLINAALLDLRAACPRIRTHRWKQDKPGWAAHRLPADVHALRSGSFRQLRPNQPPAPSNEYRFGAGEIWTPQGEYLIEYEGSPEQLPIDPMDSFDLREEEDVIQAAVLYAAAGLVMMESEYAYAALSNEYEARKAAMRPAVTVEIVPLADSLPALWDFC